MLDLTLAKIKHRKSAMERRIDDPFEYGFAGRRACTREQSKLRPEAEAVVWDTIKKNTPVQNIDRVRYLLYNGFYSLEELMRYPPFAAELRGNVHWIEGWVDFVRHQ